ncbi:MAG: HXXEE domain-containing protein [Myxococcota bacterium]
MDLSGSPAAPARATLGLLVLTFAMLWVPVGQHDFLVEHWMKLGTFMAPFLLFVAGAFREEDSVDPKRDVRALSLVMLVAYIVHQFEEHWIDLYGNVYAFYDSVNRLLQSVTGTDTNALTPEGIFVINTSLVWLVAGLAIAYGPRRIFPVLAMASIIVVNAFAHIVLGIAKFEYNPGLLTSFLVFAPVGGYVYWLALRDDLASRRDVGLSIAWGVVAHVIMVGGLIAGNVRGLFPESVYFAVLIGWSIVPVFVPSTREGRRSFATSPPRS